MTDAPHDQDNISSDVEMASGPERRGYLVGERGRVTPCTPSAGLVANRVLFAGFLFFPDVAGEKRH